VLEADKGYDAKDLRIAILLMKIFPMISYRSRGSRQKSGGLLRGQSLGCRENIGGLLLGGRENLNIGKGF
jgi:hypothetical protein